MCQKNNVQSQIWDPTEMSAWHRLITIRVHANTSNTRSIWSLWSVWRAEKITTRSAHISNKISHKRTGWPYGANANCHDDKPADILKSTLNIWHAAHKFQGRRGKHSKIEAQGARNCIEPNQVSDNISINNGYHK